VTAVVAGRMDRRVVLQTFTASRDTAGQPIKTWANLASAPEVWAQVEHLTAKESMGDSAAVGEQTTRFTMRYRDDLSVEGRIVYDGENYDIQSIVELGRREGLLVNAKKVTD